MTGLRPFDINEDIVAVDNCPLCGQRVVTAGKVDGWPGPDESHALWGSPGKRWIVCRDGHHAHVRNGLGDVYLYVVPQPET